MADATPKLVDLITRFALRLAVALAIVFLASQLIDWLLSRLDDGSTGTQMALAFTVYGAYALLIAIPFVPAAELALAAFFMQGTDIAPAIYLATLAGLLLAYLVGRVMPLTWITSMCHDLKLHKIGDALERFSRMRHADRLDHLRDRLPRILRAPLTSYRYVTVALLVNLPGNTMIGGGGGVMLMAGLSRLFATATMALTLAIAIAPVPLFVWVFGPGILDWLGLHE